MHYKDMGAERQQEIREKYRDINVDYGVEWYGDILENWKKELEALGYRDVDIQFSGFWSQGDGASFTSKHIDVRDYILAHKLGNELRLLLTQSDNISAFVTRNSHHYSHEYTVSAYVENYMNWPESVRDIEAWDKKSNEQVGQLERFIAKEVVDLSREIYKELEEDYEGATCDEAVVDTILINNYDFEDEEGEGYNEIIG